MKGGRLTAIHTKRIYEEVSSADGRRILIDRLWPRGMSKAKADIDYWAKEVAPSNDLRRWYRHDHAKWPEFKRRYFAELEANPEAVRELRDQLGADVTTLVYGSTETRLNNAAALKEFLER